MARIYSTQFGKSGDLSGAPIVYTVPVGQVAVIKDVDAVTTVAGVDIIMEVIAGDGDAIVAGFTGSGTLDSWNWRGGLVLTAGQILVIACEPAGAQGVASGFLLSS